MLLRENSFTDLFDFPQFDWTTGLNARMCSVSKIVPEQGLLKALWKSSWRRPWSGPRASLRSTTDSCAGLKKRCSTPQNCWICSTSSLVGSPLWLTTPRPKMASSRLKQWVIQLKILSYSLDGHPCGIVVMGHCFFFFCQSFPSLDISKWYSYTTTQEKWTI